ncbi:MAG: response regulator [Alphaproteobacteria bacterium]|jgi:two-component system chemotaxis response regulator CheY|nr:response regulator [Alphaproteobacteria bacterium]MDP3533471.1 response regulator [Alphaproteobacteria bacterium]
MKNCLIVDDSRVVRSVAKKIIQDLGFQTNEAENGLTAFTYCQTSMPDVILLDWNMPEQSGIDFLRDLRKSPGGDKPIVIFCTTENDLNFIVEALESGANEYIMKPFDLEIVKTKFKQVGLLPS